MDSIDITKKGILDGSSVTLISTTYNDEKEISDLLEEVFNQDIGFKEIIIADGGSRDSTIDIIKSYQNKNKCIRLLSGKRLNISQGLNAAIKKCKTDYVAIVMTGNHYDKHYLKSLYDAMQSEGTRIVFPPIRGCSINTFSQAYCNAFLSGSKGSRIPSNHGGLISLAVFQKYGLFYEHFYYAGEDAEFYNRMKGEKFLKCAEAAELKWTVPSNIKELKKQSRAYMIASNQMHGLRSIFDYKYLLVRILLYILFFVLGFMISRLFWLFGAMGFILSFFGVVKEKSVWPVLIRKLRNCFDLYYAIRYISFTKEEFRVKTDKIEYL